MSKLSFEHFLQIKEMATGKFNWKGQPIGHVNDFDKIQINWVLKKMESDPEFAKYKVFMADDGSGRLSTDQVIDALKIRLRNQRVAPTSVNKPVEPLSRTTPATQARPEPTASTAPPQTDPSSQKKTKDPTEYQIPSDKISEYQKSIEEAFSSSNKHLVINALAGTGKTTILKHLAAKFSGGKRWLYLVFNRKNADEANSGGKSFPPNVEAMTSHKFLAQVLNQTKKERPGLLPSTRPGASRSEEDEGASSGFGNKLTKILDHKWFYDRVKSLEDSLPSSKRGFLIKWQYKRKREEVVYALKSKVNQIVGLAKNFAVDPRNKDAEDKINDIMKSYKISGELYDPKDDDTPSTPDFKKEIVSLTLDILNATMPKGSVGDLNIDGSQDFDDIIWWPTLHPNEVVWPTSAQYEVALVDEVQDFNNAQKIMLSNLAKNGVRIIVVGDPHQAIYRFRGADAKGFSNIESLLSGTSRGSSTHELPVNYRSGKKIIDFVNQNTHVKTLKAGRDHEGSVNPDADEDELLSQVENEFFKEGSLKEETAFISRNNAPLFGVALGLLRKGIPFQIIGSDFSKAILDFIYRVVGNDKIPVGKLESKNVMLREFATQMESYLHRKQQMYENKKDKEKYLEELEKMYSALGGLLAHLDSPDASDSQSKNSNIRTVEDLCNHIKELFKGIDPEDNKKDAAAYEKIDKKRTVMLTTAHRSKGLEFERVNIIHDDLFPGSEDYDPSDEEGVQEHNAKYVAYTRATHSLNLSRSKDGAASKRRKR